MIDYKDCPEVLTEFLFYMETIRNRSKKTIDGYYVDLRTFFRFLLLDRGLAPADKEFSEIQIGSVNLDLVRIVTSMDIYNYLHFVTRELDNRSATRARKISALRSFFNYLTAKTGALADNPMKNIDVPSLRKSMPKYLALDEAQELLAAPEGPHSTRDYCILTLFLNCGMRLSELVGINESDIKEDSVRLLGKGNKERIVHLNPACRAALDAYLLEKNQTAYTHKDPKALFLSRTGSRITNRRVEQIVEENLKRSGLSGKGYSPHKLRHTAATLMYQYGDADMLALKEILGHEHVSTTEIYTHIANKQLSDTLDASPLAKARMPKKNDDDKEEH